MKKISVVIPCWSEEKSIQVMYDRIVKVFEEKLQNYIYEIIFVDDCSPDNTWNEIKKICELDTQVKGVHNARNFGFIRNVFATLKYGSGDATFMLFGDMQDPPENIPLFVKKWEEGHKVIIGQKTQSDENKFLYFCRTMYYKVIDSLAAMPQVKHFNGYGLYDRTFIDTIMDIEDSAPYLKGIVAEFAMNQCIIEYHQAESARGKSGSNFFKNYDIAMLGITSYTKALMRMTTFIGAIMGVGSMLFALYTFIMKCMNWNSYPMGTPTIIIGIFFIGAVQLFFLGILGEYILSINTRMLKRPLVVVDEILNEDVE